MHAHVCVRTFTYVCAYLFKNMRGRLRSNNHECVRHAIYIWVRYAHECEWRVCVYARTATCAFQYAYISSYCLEDTRTTHTISSANFTHTSLGQVKRCRTHLSVKFHRPVKHIRCHVMRHIAFAGLHARKRTCAHAHTHINKHTHKHTDKHTHKHTNKHPNKHTHKHTHTHTDKHTHKHTN